MPLELISHVCTSTEQTLTAARGLLNAVGGARDYRVHPEMYY
ncbi:DUF4433 domain-containing protein [Mycobacterium intracellulare]|nr:DUF4433 domain-containing protein [Mycobacterium intracellulare]